MHIVSEGSVGSRQGIVFRILFLVYTDRALMIMVLALGYTCELVLGVDRGASVGGDDSGVVSRVTSEVELSEVMSDSGGIAGVGE